MASPNPPEPEFTEPLPEDYQCPICQEVLKEPHLTDCCGGNFCRGCINQILRDGGHCPLCRKAGFQVLIDRKSERKILALHVYCRVKDCGCDWEGALRELDTHLGTNCQYVDVDCPNGCCERPKRHNLPHHLHNFCPKRKFSCPYCHFKATYEHVANQHWPECKMYPLPCPNDCGVGTVERCRLEHHLGECPLQMVECEFSHAGCTEKVRRKDTARHMEESTQKHLLMVSTSMMNMKLLQEKDRQIWEHQQQQIREQQQQIREQQEQIDTLQVKVRCVEDPTAIVAKLFTMTEFHRHWRNGTFWYSSSFYTHSGGPGYKINNLGVRPKATHIEVWMVVAVGDYDGQLQWPRDCTITIQLLNQLGEHNHFTKTVEGVLTRPTCMKTNIIWSDAGFIAHSDLGYKADTNTQYLKDDCLQFKIVGIWLK